MHNISNESSKKSSRLKAPAALSSLAAINRRFNNYKDIYFLIAVAKTHLTIFLM